MIHRVGRITSKSKVTSTRATGPYSYRSIRLSDGFLLGQGAAFDSLASDTVSTINSTNRISAKESHANTCLHTVERTNVPQGRGDWFFYSAANPTVRQEIYDMTPAARGALDIAKSAAFSSIGINGSNWLRTNAVPLITANFDSLRPDLTEVSVPNFLLDIGQISSLMKLWKYRKPLIKNIANANLNYQFGWRPTLGDVSAMISSISNLQSKIKSFQDRLGKLTTKQKTVATGGTTHSGTAQSGEITWSATHKYTCTAHIAYRPLPLKEFSAFEKMLRGVLDSWGFELNAEILWDAIPFSFVLDWFLDVGSLVRQFRLDTLELPIKLEDCYLQFKETVTVDSRLVLNPNVDHTKLVYPGASYERTLFHRLGAQPDYQSLVWSGWRFPSLNQAILGLSLGLTRS